MCSVVLQHTGSLVEVGGLSSCGAWAWLPRSMWDLSSPTKDRTCIPCIGRCILYHWTAREVPLWHLCVENWLLCTPSLPPPICGCWLRRDRPELPPPGSPPSCLPRTFLGDVSLQSQPKGGREGRALDAPPHPRSGAQLSWQHRSSEGQVPTKAPMADCCSCDKQDGRPGWVLVLCSRWRAENG